MCRCVDQQRKRIKTYTQHPSLHPFFFPIDHCDQIDIKSDKKKSKWCVHAFTSLVVNLIVSRCRSLSNLILSAQLLGRLLDKMNSLRHQFDLPCKHLLRLVSSRSPGHVIEAVKKYLIDSIFR